MRRVALVVVLALLALAGCAGEAPAPPAPRVIVESNMDAYVTAATELYRADPTYGYAFAGPLSTSERNNFEVSGRAMCRAIIEGIPALDAYEAAYPLVASAGNVGELERQDGRIAGETLCPSTGAGPPATTSTASSVVARPFSLIGSIALADNFTSGPSGVVPS